MPSSFNILIAMHALPPVHNIGSSNITSLFCIFLGTLNKYFTGSKLVIFYMMKKLVEVFILLLVNVMIMLTMETVPQYIGI